MFCLVFLFMYMWNITLNTHKHVFDNIITYKVLKKFFHVFKNLP